jgi:hypothetical protein
LSLRYASGGRRAGNGYVLGVIGDHLVRVLGQAASGREIGGGDSRTLQPSAWHRLSAAAGTKGPRLHDWCYLELADVEAEEGP